MINKSVFQRLVLTGASLFTLASFVAVPTAAQAGFFDQLFGGSSAEPRARYEEPQIQQAQPESFGQKAAPQRRRAVRRVVDDKPVLQQTTDILHDKTLHPGDAVMMKGGIHIYTGLRTATHSRYDFTPLDKAQRVSPAEKTVLASVDGTRNDPLAKAAKPDTVASGRSAAVSAPIVTGIKFTDKRGVIVRYIGP